jgi:hypothetical protein
MGHTQTTAGVIKIGSFESNDTPLTTKLAHAFNENLGESFQTHSVVFESYLVVFKAHFVFTFRRISFTMSTSHFLTLILLLTNAVGALHFDLKLFEHFSAICAQKHGGAVVPGSKRGQR